MSDDGTKFDTKEECVEYEKVTIPVYIAVDVYRHSNAIRHTEQVLGVFFSREKAEKSIDDIMSRRNNNDDHNQRYEVRTTKMTKEFYESKA